MEAQDIAANFGIPHHAGHMSIEARQESIDLFMDGTTKFMATTSVLDRAIDGPDVKFIINYQVPESKGELDAKAYLHRSGRGGRFGQIGLVISFIKSLEVIRRISEEHDVEVQII